jgi:NTP pyrophosphatase (non-canonical NTP hydrolase)
MNLRPALKTFAETQEDVLRSHDASRGEEGWKDMTAQELASRMCEEFGEVITEMFGQDDVCDFLVASLRDHIETCGVDVDFNAENTRREAADVANFCMFLHDKAGSLGRTVSTAN